LVKDSDSYFGDRWIKSRLRIFIFFLLSGLNVANCYFVILSLIQYVFVVYNNFSCFIINIAFVVYRNDVKTVAERRYFLSRRVEFLITIIFSLRDRVTRLRVKDRVSFSVRVRFRVLVMYCRKLCDDRWIP